MKISAMFTSRPHFGHFRGLQTLQQTRQPQDRTPTASWSSHTRQIRRTSRALHSSISFWARSAKIQKETICEIYVCFNCAYKLAAIIKTIIRWKKAKSRPDDANFVVPGVNAVMTSTCYTANHDKVCITTFSFLAPRCPSSKSMKLWIIWRWSSHEFHLLYLIFTWIVVTLQRMGGYQDNSPISAMRNQFYAQGLTVMVK